MCLRDSGQGVHRRRCGRGHAGIPAAARSHSARDLSLIHISAGGHSYEINPQRTSDGTKFKREETPLVARIEARIARLVQWPQAHAEGLQIMYYRPGAEYKPHYDYFDPALPGTSTLTRNGGQRVASLVMYLSLIHI